MRYEETYKAMLGKGFTGDIRLAALREFTMIDLAAALLFGAAGIIFMIA